MAVRPRVLNCALLAVLALVLSSCGAAHKDVDLNTADLASTAPPTDPAATLSEGETNDTVADEVYKIQAGDTLEIVFFTHPEQNRFSTVRPDGRISLPHVGELLARGREPLELAALIREGYADVLVEPQVDVLLHELGGRYYIMGEVYKGGEFKYERPISMLQAIAQAGGFTGSARLTNIVLIRRDGAGKRYAAILDFRKYMGSEDKSGDVTVEPYDIVWIPRDLITRWDNAARKSLASLIQAEDLAIKGRTLADFNDVYQRQF